MSAKLGRPSAISAPFTLEVLQGIRDNTDVVSVYYLKKLAAKGYVAPVVKKFTTTPGRPNTVYELTSKGKFFIAGSKNWFKKTA